MKYTPDYQLNILPEEGYEDSIAHVEEKLDEIKHSGSFTAFDGINIYYEYFLAENSRGSVVIVHGLSEFTRKFYELIYYFLNQGFSVFIHDQRCHGLSERLTPEKDLLHVDKFEDYVKDLSYFIDEIVLKAEDKPLYMYAHSMGGAVSTLYLAKNGHKIKKAIFTAPMFRPVVHDVPFIIARDSVTLGRLVFGGKRRFFINHDFDPNVKFVPAEGLSRARFEYNMKLRRENPYYQSTPISFGWTYGSLTVGRKILSSRVAKRIETPILLISAEKDEMVKIDAQEKFASRCNCCRFESIENATHGVLASDEGILSKVLNLIFEFWA